MSEHRPPRLWSALLEAAADPVRRDAQLGDLAEEFEERRRHDPVAARRWYRRQVLGSIAPNVGTRVRARRTSRDSRRGEGRMAHVLGDFRHALRGFGRALGFHAVVVLTLGLGIGAITTTFSVVYGLVLAPFPFPEPDRIVGVGSAYPRLGSPLGFFENLSPAEFEDIRDGVSSLEEVVAWDMGNRQIDTDGPPENVFTAFWWGDPLTTLGMDAHLGRGFTEDEIRTGAAAAMIGYDTWVTRFGADSSLVGSSLGINGTPHTLVGIVPQGVDIYGTELWTVMSAPPSVFPRGRRQFQTMGRIVEGSSLREVNAELAGLASRVERAWVAELEEYEGWSLQALTWTDVSSQTYRTGLYVLFGAVSFVLLLVCANTANLLLARARARRREMAVRAALGAARGRLFAQVLVESVTLAFAGGAVGVALALLGVAGVNRFVATVGFGMAGSVTVEPAVLLFSAGVAVVSGILFGIAPALQASASAIGSALGSEARGSTAARSRQRLQRTLVAVQVCLALVLLSGSGLLVNSLVRVVAVDPGFDAERVLTMRLTLPRERYTPEEVPAFFRTLTERLEASPSVERAGAGTQYPGVAFSFRQIFVDGVDADAEGTLPTVLTTVVTPGYFEALGMRIRSGRTLDARDATGAPNAVVINEEAARRWFVGRDPVGSRLKIGDAGADTPWWEVVGVVGATRNLGLDRDVFPEVFASHEQVGGMQNQLFLTLRTRTDPREAVEDVRAAVRSLDPNQAVYAIRTAEETLRQGVLPMRANAIFLTIFAGFALVLAVVGIYSVVSFGVAERTQEIGVRVALGADRGRVRRLVVRQALVPVAAGAGVGLVGAIGTGRALTGLLFEVRGGDPVTLAVVTVVLIGAAVAASWAPAFRASRLDPNEALRRD